MSFIAYHVQYFFNHQNCAEAMLKSSNVINTDATCPVIKQGSDKNKKRAILQASFPNQLHKRKLRVRKLQVSHSTTSACELHSNQTPFCLVLHLHQMSLMQVCRQPNLLVSDEMNNRNQVGNIVLVLQ